MNQIVKLTLFFSIFAKLILILRVLVINFPAVPFGKLTGSSEFFGEKFQNIIFI